MAGSEHDYTFLWKRRKYLLLLATLVASVTYDAGLNPPGGVWAPDDDKRGSSNYITGDPVLPMAYLSRYWAFFYCNATAFVASLVVIMILLDRRVSGNRVGVTVLRSAMVLDLLALMGAYAAGSPREVLPSVYVSALFALAFAYVALHIVVATSPLPPVRWLRESLKNIGRKLEELLMKGEENQVVSRDDEDRQEQRKFPLLLATFATPLTYGAGLLPPGGFWDDDKEGSDRTAGVPVLHDVGHARRYQAFFYCNATSFVASLAIVMLLMSRTLSDRVGRSYALQVCVLVELLGLVGAYAAGSCRKPETTIYVVSLTGAVLVYIALQIVVGMFAMGAIKKCLAGLCRILQCRRLMEQEQQLAVKVDRRAQHLEMKPSPTPITPCDGLAPVEDVTGADGDVKDDTADTVEESRSLLLLLATLAATVTYGAGLSPPGGFWQAGDDGKHNAGDLVLLEKHPKRYKAFFHCNTAAFVASLVVIVIVQSKQLSSGAVVKHRALHAAMTLDLLSLMGAYAAGSCRDTATTIYVSALAVAVFVYSIGNVVAFNTLGLRRETRLMHWVDGMVENVLKKLHLSDGHAGESDDDLEKKRKFLLQLAILAATATYKTGLTPPGGFWSNDDHAGDPVLIDHYRKRYLVFFYCNATGFMASVVVILMLVKRRLYSQGIRSNALHACVLVGLLGLMGAYAAGSCRNLSTSVYVIALVAAVIGFLLLQILLFVLTRNIELPTWVPRLPSELPPANANTGQHTEQYMKRKYLMLLGILAASVTYQAGLSPPGGTWGGDDGDEYHHYVAGNPILHDIDPPRYHAFFHCNATSFVASVVVIVLLLQRTVKRHSAPLWAMQTAVVLDLLGLLGAYAAGSCRDWETSVYVIALLVAVVVYITLHVLLSFDAVAAKAESLKVWKYCGGSGNGGAV